MLAGGWFHEGCLGVDIVVALLSKLTLTHGDLRDSRCECVQHVNACEVVNSIGKAWPCCSEQTYMNTRQSP